jgi:predicted  nucleic acid-binding Zn-ribbon protein
LANQIELLIRLQVIDRQLRERTESIETLRQQAAELEAELEQQRRLLETCQAERAELEVRRRDLDAQLTDEEGKMKERRMRLNRIRNEKEAAAVRREIELGKEVLERIETEGVDLLGQLEGLGARERELQGAFDALDARWKAERARVESEVAALSHGIDEMRRQREEVAAGIEAALRGQYETIFGRKRGLAVVEVRGGTCEGCHMRIAPQLVNEIHRNQRVVTCPSCHRILYVRAEPAVSEA